MSAASVALSLTPQNGVCYNHSHVCVCVCVCLSKGLKDQRLNTMRGLGVTGCEVLGGGGVGDYLVVVPLAAFAVPAAGDPLHYLLPLTGPTRDAADGRG